MVRRKQIAQGLAAVLAWVFLASMDPGYGIAAEQWPRKPIELVVAFAAGGGTDVAARIIVKHLSPELGVPVTVVNKAGGNQIPGVLYVLKSAKDGYTLLVDQPATSSLHGGTIPDLPYKLEDRAFGPIFANGMSVIHVSGKSQWKSLKEVAESAKKDPGSFTWARSGGYSDYTLMQFLYMAGVDLAKTKPVDFPGVGRGNTAVAGGHVMMGGGGLGAAIPLHQSGNLRILAMVGEKRASALPNIPSSKEEGYPINLLNWYGISGPKDTAKQVIDRLDAAAKKLAQNPAYIADLDKIGAVPYYTPPVQARDWVFKEVDIYKRLVATFSK